MKIALLVLIGIAGVIGLPFGLVWFGRRETRIDEESWIEESRKLVEAEPFVSSVEDAHPQLEAGRRQ